MWKDGRRLVLGMVGISNVLEGEERGKGNLVYFVQVIIIKIMLVIFVFVIILL